MSMPLLIATVKATVGPKVPVRSPRTLTVQGLGQNEIVRVYDSNGLLVELDSDGEHPFPLWDWSTGEIWAEKVSTSANRLYVWVD